MSPTPDRGSPRPSGPRSSTGTSKDRVAAPPEGPASVWRSRAGSPKPTEEPSASDRETSGELRFDSRCRTDSMRVGRGWLLVVLLAVACSRGHGHAGASDAGVAPTPPSCGAP